MHTIHRIIQAFELFPNWDDRYRLLTEIGAAMPPLGPEHQNPANQVHGCMSKVWIIGSLSPRGVLAFAADCDTPVVKGLVALLMSIFQDKTPEAVIDTDVDGLFHSLGLDENLSPNRHVGMYAMVDTIKTIARGQLRKAA